MLATSYPFLNLVWTMLVFFAWVLWFVLLFRVFGDIFRRQDISGWGKAGWLIFTILLPFLGVFVYLISQNDGMTKRTMERASAQQAQFDDYVRQTATTNGDPATEIAKAKGLLDSGAITATEFEALKQKTLA